MKEYQRVSFYFLALAFVLFRFVMVEVSRVFFLCVYSEVLEDVSCWVCIYYAGC